MRKWILILFSLGLTAAILYFALDDRGFAIAVYGRATYYLILALILFWMREIFRNLSGFPILEWTKKNRYPILSAALLTAMSFSSSPPKFRVLSDETNLLSVSQAMLYDKSAFNNTQTKWYYGGPHPITFELEKRPMLFPFLVQVVHMVRGYHYQNPFILNAILLFILLTMAGCIAYSKLDLVCAISAQLLLISYPLLVSTATSGGFDLLASVCAANGFFFLYRFMKNPDEKRASMLFASLLLFIHARYESFLFVAVISIGLLYFRYIKLQMIWDRISLYTAAPLLMIPIAIQRILIPSPYENLPGQPPFAFAHFKKFISTFIRSQTDFDFMIPHSHLINWVAMPVAIFSGIRLWSKHFDLRLDYRKNFLSILVTSFVISYLVFFSYYFGDYTHPASARFFLNAAILSSLMPVVLHVISPELMTRSRLLIFAVAGVLLYHPISVGERFTNIQNLIRETDYAMEFLKKKNDKNVLIVNGRPGQFSALGYSAIDYLYLSAHRDEILAELKRHLYTEIIVIQRIDYGTQAAVPHDEMDPVFKMETLAELQTTASEFTRISRVVY